MENLTNICFSFMKPPIHEVPRSSKKFQDGSRRLVGLQRQESSRRFKRVQEGSRRFTIFLRGSRKSRKVKKGSKRLTRFKRDQKGSKHQ